MKNTLRQQRPESSILSRVIIAVLVIGCMFAAWKLPLWNMKLTAPMYPNGLHMIAYGDKFGGDLYELNIVNHYVGMKHIKPEDISEMALFPVGLVIVSLLGIVPIFRPKLHKLCGWLALLFPIVILGFIQYYLYEFGHGLNPEAPIKIPEFTPVALGSSTIVNFTATSMIDLGMVALILASALIGFGYRLFPAQKKSLNVNKEASTIKSAGIVSAVLTLVFFASNSAYAALGLQQQINNASRGDTLVIDGGVHQGPIYISKPIVLIGKNVPQIHGDKKTDVVIIKSDSVVFRGFHIMYSGIEITQEASGIRSQGDHVLIADNIIDHVYFGIHILQSDSIDILHNTISPGQEYAGRPGHAISAWNVNSITIRDNIINDARDGILLTYAEKVNVTGNSISGCRYGLHSMYSKSIIFDKNLVRDNLLGMALMYSKTLVARENSIIEHRRGTSPYGLLLKDVDNIELTGNRIQANQVGIYAEGVSMAFESNSTFKDNLIVGNLCGISVQSNAKFVFTGNSVVDNLADVRTQSERINSGVKWEADGVGNFWSNYRGYDKAQDGIGDIPYRVEEIAELAINADDPMQALLYTPGYLVIESATRLFPIFKSLPIVEDTKPLLTMSNAAMTIGYTNDHSYLFASISALILISGVVGVTFFKPFDRRTI